MYRRITPVLIFILLNLLPATVFASFVKLVQSSATTFSVDFDNFSNVGGVLVTIKYDPDTGTVTGARQGSSIPSQTQYVTGTPVPGELRIVIAGLVALPKSGNLATVTFNPKAGAEVAIREVSVKLSTADAKPLPNAFVQVYKGSFTNTPPADNAGSGSGASGSGSGSGTNGTGTGAGNTGTGSTGTGTINPVSGVSGGSGGSWRSTEYVETVKNQAEQAAAAKAQNTVAASTSNVTIAGGAVTGTITPPETKNSNQSEATETVQAARQSVGVDRGEEASDSKDKKNAPKKEESISVNYEKIAERFKNLSAKSDADELINLFAEPAASLISQSPEIAYISDKEIKLQVSTELLLTSEPSFIVKGASLTDIKLSNGKWMLVVTPKPKFREIKLVIMDGGERTVEYPLVVVPKIKLIVDSKKKINKTDFSALIKDMNSEKSLYDFNDDKKHDYLDDYIYTANFIRESGVKPVKTKKKETEAVKAVKSGATAESPSSTKSEKPVLPADSSVSKPKEGKK